MDFVHMSPFLALGGLGIIGLIVGSFLSVVIYRLPIIVNENIRCECSTYLQQTYDKNISLTLYKPRSFCTHCGKSLSYWMNIPIISYLILRGKCHYCRSKINIRYLLIEILTSSLMVILGIYFGLSLKLIATAIFTMAMLVLALIDLDTKQLPDQITLSVLWLGLLFNCWNLFTTLVDALLGAMLGYLFFFLIAWVFRQIRKKEVMGHGDFKLLACLGAWFGWQALPAIVLIASTLGTIISMIFLFATKQAFDTKIPFGPFLILGGMNIMFWGNLINRLYF